MENPITDEQRENLLCSAIEGGSNYWYWLSNGAVKLCRKHGGEDRGVPLVTKMWAAIKAGEIIPIHDVEEHSDMEDDDDEALDHVEPLGKISLESIKRGEELMLKNSPDHFANIVSEDDDAETGDVWFQYVVLGEIVYG